MTDRPEVYVHPDVDRNDPTAAMLIRMCEADERGLPWMVLPIVPVAPWWQRLLGRVLH